MSTQEIETLNRPAVTFQDVRTILYSAFGQTGAAIADAWAHYSETYWNGTLEPCPIFLPAATPYGRWNGLCTYTARHVINLQLKYGQSDEDMRNVLLHEMVHQALVEQGVNPKHDDTPWCEEIMRISRDHFGERFWAAPSKVDRINGKCQRVQPNGPDGAMSLPLPEIARWPFSVGIQAPFRFLSQ